MADEFTPLNASKLYALHRQAVTAASPEIELADWARLQPPTQEYWVTLSALVRDYLRSKT